MSGRALKCSYCVPFEHCCIKLVTLYYEQAKESESLQTRNDCQKERIKKNNTIQFAKYSSTPYYFEFDKHYRYLSAL